MTSTETRALARVREPARTRERRDVVVGLAIAAIAAIAVVVVWVGPASTAPVSADVLGTLTVAVATVAILAVLGLVGVAASAVVPARSRRALPLGLLLAFGATTLALSCLVEHAILGRVLVAPYLVVVAAVAIVVVRIVRASRSSDVATVAIAMRRRVGDRVLSLDVVAIALVSVVMLPVARHGLTGWTLGIYDWHRYAGSVLVWMQGEDGFLEAHPDAYGASQAARASFEKPAVTALLVAIARLTGIHPVGLLTPFLLVMLVVLVTSAMALVRIAFAASARTALLVSAPATLSTVVMLPIAQAQPGGLAATALLVGVMACVALLPTVATRGEAVRVGSAAGAMLAVAVASNATLMLAAMPVALAVAAWVALRWRMPAARAVAGAVAAAVVAAAVLLPQVGRFARSLEGQVDGSAGIAMPLVSPAGVVGLEVAGGVPGLVAVGAWAVVVASAIAAAWTRRRSPDGLGVLGVTSVFALTLVALALVYGIDGYSTGKWLGVAAPLVVPPVLAACVAAVARMGALQPTDRAGGAVSSAGAVAPSMRAVVAPALAGMLGVVAVLAASPLVRVDRVLPVAAMQLASSQEFAAEGVVNVDLDDRHAATLVPLLVPSGAVVSMDPTYAAAADPVGDAFLVDAEGAVGRDWLESADVAPGFVAGTLDLDVEADGLTLLEPGGGDHLFGGWLGREPEATLLDAGAAEAFVVLDAADVPARLVVTGYTEGPTTVVVTVGDETVEASPSDGVLAASVPVDAADVVDGRIVVRIDVLGDGSGVDAVTRIDGVAFAGRS